MRSTEVDTKAQAQTKGLPSTDVLLVFAFVMRKALDRGTHKSVVPFLCPFLIMTYRCKQSRLQYFQRFSMSREQ